MSDTNLHSVIDVECVSNRSKDIISFIIKVSRWFLLNNKILTFHHLFTFTESFYNTLLYVCGGEGYCELLANYADFLFIVPGKCNFAIPGTSIAGMEEVSRFREAFEFIS